MRHEWKTKFVENGNKKLLDKYYVHQIMQETHHRRHLRIVEKCVEVVETYGRAKSFLAGLEREGKK